MRRIAALPLLAAAAVAAGCGGSGQRPAPGPVPTAAQAETALAARMAAKDLSIHYAKCVDEGVRRGGEAVFRCNVNFGEPHIEGYCVVVRDGTALTQYEDPALRCNRTRTGDTP